MAKVFHPPQRDAKSFAPPRRVAGTKRCMKTPHVTVAVDPALGAAGEQLAGAVGAVIEAAYVQAAAFCNPPYLPAAVCQIAQLSPGSDGTGGAYHNDCADTVLVCDADFQRPERTVALFVAELVEVFEALLNTGWSCGDTNGEGLSRAIAEAVQPGALDDYASFGGWLDGERADWVHYQQGTDTDLPSVGCAVGFLWWLVSLGHAWPEIVAAAGPTLAETYARLGHPGDAFADFQAACEQRWPAGSPSGIRSDNPWGGATPAPPTPPQPEPPPGPTPPPPSPLPVVLVSLSEDTPAGNYQLVPVNAEQPAKK